MSTRLLSALVALLAWTAVASAQAGGATPGVPPGAGVTRRPTISPYLNLLRGGNPAVNYAGLVRPEQQLFANQSRLQTQLGGVSQDVNQLQNTPYSGLGGDLVTGNAFGFQTQRSYFLTTGTGGGGAGGVAGFGTTGGVGNRGGVGLGMGSGRTGLRR